MIPDNDILKYAKDDFYIKVAELWKLWSEPSYEATKFYEFYQNQLINTLKLEPTILQ